LVRPFEEHFGRCICSSTKEEFVVWGRRIRILYRGTAKIDQFDLDIAVSEKKSFI
jgi:hypothetical protein